MGLAYGMPWVSLSQVGSSVFTLGRPGPPPEPFGLTRMH